METASTINTVIQICANCIGFIMFFSLLKTQIKKRDDAFDKVVEIVNQMLRRLDIVENDQKHMRDDIKEVKDKQYLISYNHNKK